jgi:hypothetical protein
MKANDDLLESTIPVSKLEHFAKKRFVLILTMARIQETLHSKVVEPHCLFLQCLTSITMRTQSPRRKNGRSLHHDKQNSPKRQPGLKKAIPDIAIEIQVKIIYLDGVCHFTSKSYVKKPLS